MDLLIPAGVLLLVISGVAFVLARQGRVRQTKRTAKQYGARSTYQPTFEDPTAKAPEPAAPQDIFMSGSAHDPEVREAAERLASDMKEFLKAKGAGIVTVETAIADTVTLTTTSTTMTNDGGALSGPPQGGTRYTERSLSLTEETAGRVKSLALAGKRHEALALLKQESGLGGKAGEMMLNMIVEEFPG